MNIDGQNSGYDITISGDSSAYFDELSCGTFQGVPGAYFTGITSNIQTQIDGISGGLSGTYVTLATSQNITGQKTFNTTLPTSTLTPTTSTQLITKGYGDSNYGLIAAANTWNESNEFVKGIVSRTVLTASNVQVGSANMMGNRQVGSVDNVGIGVDAMKGDADPTGYIYSTGSRNTAVGNYALMQQGSGNECTAIGFQAMQLTGLERIYGAGVSPYYCTAIGVNSQRVNLYGYSNISIGVNCLNNVGSGTGNIIIGNNGGNGLGNAGSCVVIGDGAMPSAVDNGIVCIGAGALGAALNQCNSGTFVGSNAGRNNNNGQSNTFIGANAGVGNGNGSNNCCLGVYAGRLSPSSGNFVVCIGYDSFAVQSNEFVIGGNNFSDRGELTLPNKTRLACNQTQTAATLNLGFRENENVLLTSAGTTVINLPTPATTGVNEGAKFYINRKVAGANITINAPSGQTLALNQANGTYTTSASYTWSSGSNSITVLCIGSGAGGTNWQILPPGISQGSESMLLNTTVPLPALNYSIPFGGITTAGYQPQFMDNTNMNYQPSTQILTVKNATITGTLSPTLITTSSINTVGSVDLNVGSATQTTKIIGGLTVKNGAQKVGGYGSLSGTPNVLTKPLNEYYTLATTANGDVTLPVIDSSMYGSQVTFVKISAAATWTINAGIGDTFRLYKSNSTATATSISMAYNNTVLRIVATQASIWDVILTDIFAEAARDWVVGTQYFPMLMNPTNITAATNWNTSLPSAFYGVQGFSLTVNSLITLPLSTNINVPDGLRISFRRVGGTLATVLQCTSSTGDTVMGSGSIAATAAGTSVTVVASSVNFGELYLNKANKAWYVLF